MGNCESSLNCTSPAQQDDVVTLNADIAGNGVLAAFLISCLLTVTALFYAYFSDSLPERSLSQADKYLILWVQRKASRLRFPIWLSTICKASNVSLRRMFGLDPSPAYTVPLSRKQREEALGRFILAISDQQLVTGPAILIACLYNRCTLTVRDFQLAYPLAWFSSTTHLASLSAFTDYFMRNKTVRNWRIAGMLSFVAALCYSLPLENSLTRVGAATPLQCAMSGKIASLNHDPIGKFVSASAIIILITSWLARLGLHHTLAQYINRILFNFQVRSLRKKHCVSHDAMLAIFGGTMIASKCSRRRMRLHRLRRCKGMKQCVLAAAMDYPGRCEVKNFFQLIPDIIFHLAYGLSKLFYSRWGHIHGSAKVDGTMGFGQITALFLLALPLLSAADMYYDAKSDSSSSDPETTRPTTQPTLKTFYTPESHWLCLLDLDKMHKEQDAHHLQRVVDDSGADLDRLQRAFPLETAILTRAEQSEHIANCTTCPRVILQWKADLFQDFQFIERFQVLSFVKLTIISGLSLAVGVFLNVPTAYGGFLASGMVGASASLAFLKFFLEATEVLRASIPSNQVFATFGSRMTMMM